MAYTEEEGKRLVIEAGHRLVEAGLIARTWGNISARISDTEFVITPSGMAYDKLTPDKIVKVKIADCSYEGDIKPSSEKGVHAEGYRLRPECNFIVHTHQLLATAASVTGEKIEGYGEAEQVILGPYVANAEYAISSTKKLMKKVSACIEANPKARAVLMRSHGTVCLGSDFEDAFAISKALEKVSYEKIARDLEKKGFAVDAAALAEQENEPLLNKLMEAYRAKVGSNERVVTNEVIPENVKNAVKTAYGSEVIAYNTDPMVQTISLSGSKIVPIIDDMAQIGGVSFACLSGSEAHDAKKVTSALKGRTIVLVKGIGALTAAPDEDELEAIRMVLDKDFVAELYASLRGGAKHLGFLDAKLQRTVYTKKYSKLK